MLQSLIRDTGQPSQVHHELSLTCPTIDRSIPAAILPLSGNDSLPTLHKYVLGMAFDQHIAADQIDEFNLFSAFVRVPLLILGGVLGSRRSSNNKGGSHFTDDDDGDCEQSTTTMTTTTTTTTATESAPRLQSRICLDLADVDPSSRRIVSDFSMDECEGTGMRRGKKTSWSDESGRKLVQYDDEVSLCPYYIASVR